MKGDFTGFSFAGYHSSDLGIVRVSGGDRYKDNLIPELEDKTVDIPGNNGQYFFGSTFKQKTFDIDIAFDSLTEQQYVFLRRLFSIGEPKPLVFDEWPYKTYYVKVDSPPELNTVCFDEEIKIKDLTELENFGIVKREGREEFRHERYPVLFPEEFVIPTTIIEDDGKEAKYKPEGGEEGEEISYDPPKYYRYDREYTVESRYIRRIYKGEGSIHFVAFSPFGRCQGDNKDLTTYLGDEDSNVNEWNYSVNLIKLKANPEDPEAPEESYDEYILNSNGGYFKVYNPGQIKAEPMIYIPFNNVSGDDKILINNLEINLSVKGNVTEILKIKKITTEDKGAFQDTGIFINSHNHLIEGVKYENNSFITTGKIYNDKIDIGDFIKIPCSNLITNTNSNEDIFPIPSTIDKIILKGTVRCDESARPQIIYDYLFY